MRSRADEIRRRIAKRKRERERLTKKTEEQSLWVDDAEKLGFDRISSFEGEPEEMGHPLFRKEIFLFKVLASACLVLIVAIIYRNDSPSLQQVKNFVAKSMEQDFQFAAVSDWYEEQFGQPLAVLPFANEEEEPNGPSLEQEYALPATARILQDFQENGQGITIETKKGAPVTAMSEGRVRFAGIDEQFGKTVIIQHADKSETWYGNLEEINVSLYEFIKRGSDVGISSDSADGTTGTFYFAIKQGDDFVDPIQVIQFD